MGEVLIGLLILLALSCFIPLIGYIWVDFMKTLVKRG